MTELTKLLQQAKVAVRYWAGDGVEDGVIPNNRLAYDLAQHIEKQMAYELELTQKITKLEEENGRLSKANKSLQEHCDTLKQEVYRLQDQIDVIRARRTSTSYYERYGVDRTTDLSV